MKRQDYLDNLEQYIHEPEKQSFSDEIIPVAMWLRNFMPTARSTSRVPASVPHCAT